MNILIIGGTRFMGPHIVNELAARGHRVAVFHRGETKTELPEGVQEAFGDRDHLAEQKDKITAFGPEIVLDMMLLNERQAKELTETVSGIARRVVVASSCDVYRNYGLLRGFESGSSDPTPLNEGARLRSRLYPYRDEVKDKNDRLYDYDKIPVEQLILSQESFAGTVLRLPVVYGPGDYQHRFYSYLRRMKDNRPFIMIEKLMADLRITRGYCENCASAIAGAVLDGRASGRIYNVGEEETFSEREWIERLAGIVGWKGEVVSLPESQLPEHLKTGMDCRHHLEIDTGRIRRELDFVNPVEPDEGLRKTVKWELVNPPARDKIEEEYEAENRVMQELRTD